MNLLNLSTSSVRPQNEETISSRVWTSGINYPVIILMSAVLLAMLFVWWRSRKHKQ